MPLILWVARHAIRRIIREFCACSDHVQLIINHVIDAGCEILKLQTTVDTQMQELGPENHEHRRGALFCLCLFGLLSFANTIHMLHHMLSQNCSVAGFELSMP